MKLLIIFPLLLLVSADPNPNPDPTILDILVVADANHFADHHIRRIISMANNITSSQINLHLKIVGKILVYFNPEMDFYEKPVINDEIYVKRNFEHMIIIKGKKDKLTPFLSFNRGCNKNSYAMMPISLKDNVTMSDPVLLSRMVAASVFMTLYYNKHTDCKCGTPTTPSMKCLSDDPDFNTTSNEASLCFKRRYTQLLNSYGPYLKCLWGKTAKRPIAIPICGNGVVERYEDCDCFYYMHYCKEICNWKICSWRPSTYPTQSTTITSKTTTTKVVTSTTEDEEKTTFRLIIIIAVLLVSVIFIISLVLFCLNRRMEHRDMSSTTTTISMTVPTTETLVDYQTVNKQ